MDQEKQMRYEDEDEIDLLDLFVVLLKYRWLIIGLTLGALLLAVGGYFLYPTYQYNNALENRRVEGYMGVGMSPAARALNKDYDLVQLFRQAPLLLQSLEAAGYQTFGYREGLQLSLTDGAQQSRLLYIVQQRLIKNQSLDGDSLGDEKRLFVVEETNNGIEILYKAEEAEKARQFLEALYQNASEILYESLRPEAEATVAAYEELLAMENPSDAVVAALSEGKKSYDQAKQVIEGRVQPLVTQGSIYVITPEITLDSFQSSFKIKGIVLVLAALFLSIFLAFILNAITNVRSDEESMRKIREAMKRK